MSLPSKVNKENFRLLDLSSDEESDDLQLEIIPSRKKKITRRERSRGTPKTPEPNIGAEVRCALRWALRGTLLLWLLILTWICAALYDQVSTMRAAVDHVSTTSGAVGDALQVCHTASRELRGNASILSARLDKLTIEHAELVKRVEQTASELAAVSGQLAAAPKLADTPRRIAELQQTVGSFGSQITGFDETLASTRKQALAASAGVEEVKKLVQALDARSNETIANVTANGRREDEIKQDIATLNSTLAGRVDALENKIQLYTKTTSTAAPTTTSTSTTTTTTTAAPPGPVKPNVLGVGQ
ncbi:olfactomedin-like protein 2A isoform X2 [Cydia strobilella]|uniref:olfactomedin-like protein 2A isoform X2 n=1 Tax=Cydia strobilella TaxID=1100964 RepID=UPI003006FD02